MNQKGAITHLAFLNDAKGLDAAQSELKQQGIAFEGPEDTGIAFFKDPDGIEVEITTYYGDKGQKNDEPKGFATCRRG